MKTKRKSVRARACGFNFIDLLIVVATVLLFVTVALPWLRNSSPAKNRRIACVSQLKCVVLSFRLWANDNFGKFPMVVSTNKGGTMEYNETSQVFRHFLAMASEMATPKILLCPEDNKCLCKN